MSSATISKGRCPELTSGFVNRAEGLKNVDLDRRWYYVSFDKGYMETPSGMKLPEGVVPECLIADSFSDLKQFEKLRHVNLQESLIEKGQKIKDKLKGLAEGVKPKEGEENNNLYVYASWLTKEGILSGTSVTIDLKEDGTYTTHAWGQEVEQGLYVEHVADSHLISYTCTNVGEDEIDQRVRIMVD